VASVHTTVDHSYFDAGTPAITPGGFPRDRRRQPNRMDGAQPVRRERLRPGRKRPFR
jgi:hypothetical protein